MPNYFKNVLPLERIYKEIVGENSAIIKKPLLKVRYLNPLENDVVKQADERIRKIELDNRDFERINRTKPRFDKYGNMIGDGTWHAPYTVYDIPGTDVSISPSLSSESVYVTYRTPDGKSSTDRFSTHFSNSGEKNEKDILSELGMVRSEPRYEKKLSGRNVKKREIEFYPSSGKTYDEILSLPEDEMPKYKGMLIVDENGNKKNWLFDGLPCNLEVGRDYYIKDEYVPLFEDYNGVPWK